MSSDMPEVKDPHGMATKIHPVTYWLTDQGDLPFARRYLRALEHESRGPGAEFPSAAGAGNVAPLRRTVLRGHLSPKPAGNGKKHAWLLRLGPSDQS
jgi:hypothetical protein